MNYFKVEDDVVYYSNGRPCGTVYREVDGYYVWVPPESGGCWGSHHLVMIAELLDEMNAEWHNEVTEYFDSQKNGN